MKNLGNFFAIAAISAFAVACNQAPEADVQANEAEEVQEVESTAATTYMVDAGASNINWTGFKTYSETVHTGTIGLSEGSVTFEDGNMVAGEFVVDMTAITNEDLPAEGDYNKAKLIGHLSSPDFFDVANHPTTTFTVTKAEVAPEGNEQGATHMLSGNLEMRGITKNITIPAMVSMTGDALTLKTPEFVIDRTQWDVKALSTSISGLAKDNLVDDNIKLVIDLTAEKS